MKPLTALKNIPKAIIAPNKVFKEIKDGDELPLFFTIPVLITFKILSRYLHILLVHSDLLHVQYSDFVDFLIKEFYIGAGLITVYFAALACVGLYILAKIKRRNPNYKAIEIGVFYIMLTPILLIPFDILHLLLYLYKGIKATYLFGSCFHISLVMAFIILPIQMGYLIERFYGMNKKYIILLILPFIIFLLVYKYRPFPLIIAPRVHPINAILYLSLMIFTMIFFFVKKMKTRFFLTLLGFIYTVIAFYFRIHI